jgi:hypothetical protein
MSGRSALGRLPLGLGDRPNDLPATQTLVVGLLDLNGC